MGGRSGSGESLYLGQSCSLQELVGAAETGSQSPFADENRVVLLSVQAFRGYVRKEGIVGLPGKNFVRAPECETVSIDLAQSVSKITMNTAEPVFRNKRFG